MSGKHSYINVLGLSLGFGVAWGLSLFALGILSWQFGWGEKLMEIHSSIYVGFGPSLMGSLKGLLWGLADGFIGGFVVAIVHNCVVCCASGCKRSSD